MIDIKNLELPRTVDFDAIAKIASSLVSKLSEKEIGQLYNHYVVTYHPLIDDEGRPYDRDQFDCRYYPVSKEKWLAYLPDSIATDIRLEIVRRLRS